MSGSADNNSAAERFSQTWDGWTSQADMPDVFPFLRNEQLDVGDTLAVLLIDQFRRWQAGCEVPVEAYFERCPDIVADPELKMELILEELGHIEDRDRCLDRAAFLARFADLPEEQLSQLTEEVEGCRDVSDARASQISVDDSMEKENSQFASSSDPPMPDRVGRYAVRRVLGRGSFGVVYLAKDEELDREVAIKVPSRKGLLRAGGTAAFIREARLVAQLDHPNIVPVFDVGQTDDDSCFVVSKYIEGHVLSHRIGETVRLDEAAPLIATIAKALHAAHDKGLIHRDIKPANILLDGDNQPHIVDFGLAMREEDFGTGSDFVGTPAYMSPEQARREGHRVDARSDVYSLGVMLYEMLTGQRPHQGTSTNVLLENIRKGDIAPPRSMAKSVPRELNRVCMKALAYRVSDRYQTALEFAIELEAFVSDRVRLSVGGSSLSVSGAPSGSVSSIGGGSSQTGDVTIVPKGLRPFDADDADFFHELIPGPRDRTGLPDALRFWKLRLDQEVSDETFSVGLMYGPSGCGKSSLVKAGLLPVLADHVEAIYIDASLGEVEVAILKRLKSIRHQGRHHVLRDEQLNADATLAETFALMRRTRSVDNRKLVVIIDQFEQWLHSATETEYSRLADAVRQCDGGAVQVLLMVRDDFWMATTRFMKEVEVPLIEGWNSAAVDLFDLSHARKVLGAYGRAFNALPEDLRELTVDQETFLTKAIDAIAENGRVVCVRLTLFAEMVRHKTWSPKTLTEFGGTAGVGEAYLEAMLGQNAPARYREHIEIARNVLNLLLPDIGSDIRGATRSREELVHAVTAVNSPSAFDDVLQLLDQELRLVTLVEGDGAACRSEQADLANAETSVSGNASPGGIARSAPPAGLRRSGNDEALVRPADHFQLSHDFLVPSLRQWLTRNQRSTVRGRTELQLRELAADWNSRPEKRRLPSLLEFASIRMLTTSANWTTQQAHMMAETFRHHATRLLLLLVIAVVAWWGIRETSGNSRARNFAERLLTARLSEVPVIVEEMKPFRRWVHPHLQRTLAQLENSTEVDPSAGTSSGDRVGGMSRREIAVRMAMLPDDTSQADRLLEALLTSDPPEYGILLNALSGHGARLNSRLWSILLEPAEDSVNRRLQATAALASLDAQNKTWQGLAESVTAELVSCRSVHLNDWLIHLAPLGKTLLDPLTDVVNDLEQPVGRRHAAAEAIARYAVDHPERLLHLALVADEEQFNAVVPRLQAHQSRAVDFFQRELDQHPRRWRRPNIDDSWKTLSTEFVSNIEAGHGVIDPWFAYVVQEPLDDRFEPINDVFQEAGYGLVRLRPYVRAGKPHVAALWHRGAVGRLSEFGLTAAQARQRHSATTAKGFVAQDLAAYVTSDGLRFAVVWKPRAQHSQQTTELYLAISDKRLADLQEALIASTPVPLTRQTFLDTDSGDTRHCLIVASDPDLTYRWETIQGDRQYYYEKRSLSRRQNDVSMCADPNVSDGQTPKAIMSGIWQRGDESRSNTWIHPTSPITHANATRKNVAMDMDYIPVSIGASELKPGSQLWVTSLWHRPFVSWRGLTEFYRRKSNAAVALQRLGTGQPAFKLLARHPDPTLRSFLIDRMAGMNVSAESLIRRFQREPDAGIRQGLLLALAEYSSQSMPPAARANLVTVAADAYAKDSDPGVHSAAELLLRHFDKERLITQLDDRLRAATDLTNATDAGNESVSSDRRWYYAANDHVMIGVTAGEFQMGFRPNDEYRNAAALQHLRKVNRRFAIATKETTAEQMEAFLLSNPDLKVRESETAVLPRGPKIHMSVFGAAQYCNWLSEKSGIPREQWCYEPNDAGNYASGMVVPADSTERTGFRLPTEGEWEFACRAETETLYYFGECIDMLPKYAWFTGNSGHQGHPVGQLRPNDFGLFDMLGNGMELTAVQYLGKYTVPAAEELPEVIEDRAEELVIKVGTQLAGRGSGFLYENYTVTSARRQQVLADSRSQLVGFRVVQTLVDER